MQFEPSTWPGAAYGYSPNISSWGGNILQSADGTYNLYVAEIPGGLKNWQHYSKVIRATSNTFEGPYTYDSTVLQPEAHNPQTIKLGNKFCIFHIGNATHSPVDCSENPSGPFTKVNLKGYRGCNNPSPFQHPNGTLFVVCTWSMKRAPTVEGPWTELGHISIRDPIKQRVWEDPFLYIDHRENWHIIAHAYTYSAWPNMWVSGHMFSRDGWNWTVSYDSPYGWTIQYKDHPDKHFAALERPKINWDKDGKPAYLTNGAIPVWPCSYDCTEHGIHNVCAACKHWQDYSFTVIRPFKRA